MVIYFKVVVVVCICLLHLSNLNCWSLQQFNLFWKGLYGFFGQLTMKLSERSAQLHTARAGWLTLSCAKKERKISIRIIIITKLPVQYFPGGRQILFHVAIVACFQNPSKLLRLPNLPEVITPKHTTVSSRQSRANRSASGKLGQINQQHAGEKSL